MRDFKIYLLVASALLVIYLVAEYNKPQPVNWTSTLKKEHKIPFGTYIFFNRLKDVFPGQPLQITRKPVYSQLKESRGSRSNYIIIANEVQLSKYDLAELKRYISAGNSVLIAAIDFQGAIAKDLQITNDAENTYANRKFNTKLTNPALKTKGCVFDHGVSSQYFSRFDTSAAVVLAKNDRGHSNLLRYQFGRGFLYLSANPQIFSNYAMLTTDGADYISKVVSYLPENRPVVWDEYYTSGRVEDTSPLRVFFSHPSLKWAYLIALFGLITFVVYGVKRRQRIVPILDPMRNTSVEFAGIVGQLYYQQHDNSNIARKKVNQLLEAIRSAYRIKTTVLDKDFLELLVKKSGTDADNMRALFREIREVQNGKALTDDDLIALNNKIEHFYKFL